MPLNSSDQIAAASGLISLLALAVALYAIRRSNRNSSVATLVTLNESFRQGWGRFLTAQEESDKQYEFSELMNLFEIGCAIHFEKSLFGVSRELMEEYIEFSLSLVYANDDARRRMMAMVHSASTFKYVYRFRGMIINTGRDLNLGIPPQ